MSRVVKRIIAIVIVLIFIAIIVVYKVMDNKVYYNDTAVNGNTVGNLYGNGLFCEIGDTVYFANPNDNNALYQMTADETDEKKVCDDRVYFINADENYIYYSRDNNNDESQMSFLNVNTHSLCRINHNGKKIKILDDAVCSTLALSGNTLLYHHYDTDDATTLYSICIDGKEKGQVFNNATDPRCLVNDTLFFSGVEDNHFIHSLKVGTTSTATILDEWGWMPIVDSNYIYFMDLNNSNRIARVNISDGSKEILSQYGTSDYNVVGDYIYYQTIKAETDGIYKIDLRNKTEELVTAGQFNSINITSKYVYFVDYFTGAMFHSKLNGHGATIFSPNIEIE